MKKMIFFTIFISLFVACENNNFEKDYLTGDSQKDKILIELYKTFDSQKNPESRYIVNRQIIQLLRSENKLILDLYLEDIIDKYKEDPYNAYYLLVKAQIIEEQNLFKIAELYYARILEEYPDLLINDKSIYQRCVNSITNLTEDDKLKIKYYKYWLDKYNDKNIEGKAYYYMAKSYENLGDWNNSLKCYKKFLNSKYISIPEDPDAHTDANRKINILNSNNDSWAYTNLEDLLTEIKRAINNKSGFQLKRLQSQSNFFACSWSQEEEQISEGFKTGMGTMLKGRRRAPVRYKNSLDPMSNEDEAYLETKNWAYRINKWYFYFRKIDYPANPNIHKKWEWAGIYFGDKHFNNSADK